MSPRRAVAVTLLSLAMGAMSGCGASAAQAPRFFARSSVWNAPLAGGAPIDPSSPALVAQLDRQRLAHGAWINSTRFSVPVYTVAHGQPGVGVRIDIPSDMYAGPAAAATLQRALAGAPIPPAARPAAGTDRHLAIWQPSTDTIWELWRAERRPDGWHAAWGARLSGVHRSLGTVPARFGATASGLPLVAGLITIDDLERGRIDHALAIAIPDVARGRFVPPATRTDGASAGPSAIPEGTRFRLPASLDLDALGLPPLTRMIARAAQRYGMIVRDRADVVAFYAEDPGPTGNTTLAMLLGGASPGQALTPFPWNRLEVVAPSR